MTLQFLVDGLMAGTLIGLGAIGVRPAIALRSVDLPAPFGPRTAMISPLSAWIEAPLTIGKPGS